MTPVKNLKDLIEFNKTDTIELRYFDQKILEMAEKKGDLFSPEYKKSLEKMLKATRENGIDKMMNTSKLDALMAPTGSPAWKTDLMLGDHFIRWKFISGSYIRLPGNYSSDGIY